MITIADYESIHSGTDVDNSVTIVLNSIAPLYNEDTVYKINDIVRHDNQIYTCVSNTSGEWTESDWTSIILTS